MKADGDISSTYEGDNFVLLQQLSRDLVRRPYPSLAALQGDLELRERSDAPFLNDADTQLRLFELREADLVTRLAALVQDGKKQGRAAGRAWAQGLARCRLG